MGIIYVKSQCFPYIEGWESPFARLGITHCSITYIFYIQTIRRLQTRTRPEGLWNSPIGATFHIYVSRNTYTSTEKAESES